MPSVPLISPTHVRRAATSCHKNPTHRAHNSTMPPKSTRVRKWSQANHQKPRPRKAKSKRHQHKQLQEQHREAHRTLNRPKKNFKSFGALVHPKLQQLDLDGYLSHVQEIHEGESFSCVETKHFSSNPPHFPSLMKMTQMTKTTTRLQKPT